MFVMYYVDNTYNTIIQYMSMAHVYVSRAVMSDSVISWTVARQAPLSMDFSRQEYQSGLPFPSPLFVIDIKKKKTK